MEGSINFRQATMGQNCFMSFTNWQSVYLVENTNYITLCKDTVVWEEQVLTLDPSSLFCPGNVDIDMTIKLQRLTMRKIILGKGLEEQTSLDQNTDCNNFITTLAVLTYTACTSGKIVHTYVFPFALLDL